MRSNFILLGTVPTLMQSRVTPKASMNFYMTRQQPGGGASAALLRCGASFGGAST